MYIQKNTNEAELGYPLRWERLERARASRIALYHAGAIAYSEKWLDPVREWAVDAMIRFQRVMEKRVTEVYTQIQQLQET